MATSDSKEDFSIFKCPVCLDKLITPRNLPCLHSFCEQCLLSILKSSSLEKEHGLKAFDCPVCRTEIISPEPNMALEEWLRKMPLNHLILRVNNQKDEHTKTSIKCDPCSRVEEAIPAKYRCNECKEHMCEMCYTYHKRLKGSMSHTVLDLSDYLSSEKIEIKEPCFVHDNRDCDCLCFDHESLCCILCSVTKHKQCQTVKTIDEIVDTEDKCAELNEFLPLIDNMTSETKAVKEATKENLKALDEKQDSITDMVSSHIDKVKDKLDQLCDQFQKKVNQTHFDEKQALELLDGNLSGFLTTLENCKQESTVVASRGSKKQKYLNMWKNKMRISRHMKRIGKLSERRSISNYKFEGNAKFYHSTNDILNANTIGDFTSELTEGNILVGIHKILYNNVFSCSSKDYSETTFRHTYENVSTFPLSESQLSPVFRVRNIPFRIECKRDHCDQTNQDENDYLCVYLRCMLNVGNLRWSCNAEVECRLICHTVNKDNYIGKSGEVLVFAHDCSCWGWTEFIQWDNLVDIASGFIRDDRFTLEVQVKVGVPFLTM